MHIRSLMRSTIMGAATALAIASVTFVPMATLTGCDTANVQKTVASLTETLGTAVANVASLEGNPTLAAQLTKDTAAAEVAITSWQNGSAVDDVIEALGIVEDDLSLFPITDQYAPLIDLAIGTVQTLLSLIPPSQVSSVVKANLARHHVRTVFLGYPAPRNSADFAKRWNAIGAKNAALGVAAIDKTGHFKAIHN